MSISQKVTLLPPTSVEGAIKWDDGLSVSAPTKDILPILIFSLAIQAFFYNNNILCLNIPTHERDASNDNHPHIDQKAG
jgi:hypothetical protein